MYVYNYHTNPGVPGVVNHNERYLATQKSCSYTISTDDTSPNEFAGATKMDNKPHEWWSSYQEIRLTLPMPGVDRDPAWALVDHILHSKQEWSRLKVSLLWRVHRGHSVSAWVTSLVFWNRQTEASRETLFKLRICKSIFLTSFRESGLPRCSDFVLACVAAALPDIRDF